MYVRLKNEYELEYPPKNKGTVINYNLNEELLLNDGYKPLLTIEKPNNDRLYEIKHEESENNIQEVINYLESEEEYENRKKEENIQSQINVINIQINELDLKRIRAVCEPSIKDETTGETWLEYYNAQVLDLRNQISTLRERITPNDITNENLSPLDSRES